MAAIADYESSLLDARLETVSPDKLLDWVAAFETCSAHSTVQIVSAVTSFGTMGHEVAHILASACAESRTEPGPWSDLDAVLGCQHPFRDEEVADVWSLKHLQLVEEIAKAVDDGAVGLESQPECPFENFDPQVLDVSPAGLEYAKSVLNREHKIMLLLSMMTSMEFELASGGTPKVAARIYHWERDNGKSLTVGQIHEHYLAHARALSMNVRAWPHGVPAIRALGFLAASDLQGFCSNAKSRNIENRALVRLSGLLVGQIAQVNMTSCSASPQRAERLAWTALGRLIDVPDAQ
jgi:hypothetical protein